MNWDALTELASAGVSLETPRTNPRTRNPMLDPATAPLVAAPPAKFRLPDGTPLVCTMTRKSLFVQFNQRFGIQTPDEALLFLYLCRPQFDTRARWRVPAPSDDSEPTLRTAEPDFWLDTRIAAEDWADTLPHTQLYQLYVLAINLWDDAHETAVQPIAEEAPAAAPDAKKNEESSPTGPNPSVSNSPTWGPATTCSTPVPSGTSTPPCTPSTSPTASMSSLRGSPSKDSPTPAPPASAS